jgi:hypothetical protein
VWRSYHKVCSRHFPQLIRHGSWNRLPKTAVPCLNLPEVDIKDAAKNVIVTKDAAKAGDDGDDGDDGDCEAMDVEYADDPCLITGNAQKSNLIFD